MQTVCGSGLHPARPTPLSPCPLIPAGSTDVSRVRYAIVRICDMVHAHLDSHQSGARLMYQRGSAQGRNNAVIRRWRSEIPKHILFAPYIPVVVARPIIVLLQIIVEVGGVGPALNSRHKRCR